MPAEALPYDARPTGATPTGRLYRVYADALSRPMRGQITLQGQTRTEVDGRVVLPAPVLVDLVDGVLDVTLPPDTYTLTAALRTVDGTRAQETASVVVE